MSSFFSLSNLATNYLRFLDYYNDLDDDKPTDIIPMQVVTMGKIASSYAQKLYKDNVTNFMREAAKLTKKLK